MIIYNVEQRTPEWYALRSGLPTASFFNQLITSTGEPSKSLPGYAFTLAAEKYAGKPVDAFIGNSHTERGLLLEPDAKSMYVFMTDCAMQPLGFATDDLGRYGCSPDGLVEPNGVLEVKCLKAENHIKALLYYAKNKTCQPEYVQQTQGQMLICDRGWCDLFFYHPELPPLIIRQEFNAEFSKALLMQLVNVITERDKILAEITNFHREPVKSA